MAAGEDCRKVLCAICGRSAVKKRVICLSCLHWMHNSCATKGGKKYCCDNPKLQQDFDAIGIDDRAQNNEDLLTSSDIDESKEQEIYVLKVTNLELVNRVKSLEDEVRVLRAKLD